MLCTNYVEYPVKMFKALTEIAASEAERQRYEDLRALEEQHLQMLDRRRKAEITQQLMETRTAATQKRIQRDAKHQEAFNKMTQGIEQTAQKVVSKVSQRVKSEETLRRHVFETLYSEVAEESRMYQAKLEQEQDPRTISQYFTHAHEQEPPNDSDDEEVVKKVVRKKAGANPANAAAPKKGLTSFLPF